MLEVGPDRGPKALSVIQSAAVRRPLAGRLDRRKPPSVIDLSGVRNPCVWASRRTPGRHGISVFWLEFDTFPP